MSKPNYPTDAAGFKTWADAACTTWPEHLTKLAHSAWLAKTNHPAHPLSEVDDFDAAYAAHVLSGGNP